MLDEAPGDDFEDMQLDFDEDDSASAPTEKVDLQMELDDEDDEKIDELADTGDLDLSFDMDDEAMTLERMNPPKRPSS